MNAFTKYGGHLLVNTIYLFLLLLAHNPLSAQNIELNAKAKAPLLFIVDASGSMSEIFHDVPRMVAARVMLFEKLKDMEADVPIGLVAYGNRIPGCMSHRIYAPIRTKNRQSLVEQIKNLYPAGATPLGNTLKMVGTRLLPYYPGARVVIISDGAESCGGDPVREIQKIQKRGYAVSINVIGLDVDILTSLQLKAMAKAGNGQYYDVKNHSDFANAIAESTRDVNPVVVEHEPQKVIPVENPESILKITKLYPAMNADGQQVWKVKYEFQSAKSGDYYVQMKLHNHPIKEGPGTHLPGDGRLLSANGDAWYSVRKGVGELEIPVGDDKALANQRIFVQGELWDLGDIPQALYVSNALETKND